MAWSHNSCLALHLCPRKYALPPFKFLRPRTRSESWITDESVACCELSKCGQRFSGLYLKSSNQQVENREVGLTSVDSVCNGDAAAFHRQSEELGDLSKG